MARAQASPVMLVLIGVFFTALPGIFIVVGAKLAIAQATKLHTYLPVPATISASSVVRTQGRKGPSYSAHIGFRYLVDGRSYLGSTFAPSGMSSSSSSSSAQDLVDAYPVGMAVTAYRSPGDPGQSFLSHQPSFGPYVFMLFPMIHLSIGISVLLFSIGGPRKPLQTAQRIAVLAALWDVVGLAVLLHYAWMRGPWLWLPAIVLIIYGTVCALLTRAAWSRWSKARPSPVPAADALALDSDPGNPYRRS